MGDALLQVVDLELRRGVHAPLSFEVTRGEIHALLFPPEVDRRPLLSVLAGGVRPIAGRVDMPSGHLRVAALAADDSGTSGATPAYDALLLDEGPAPANDRQARERGARAAFGRASGTAIIVATSSFEQAYRSDRVSLAMWNEAELREAYRQLSVNMVSLVDEFVRVFESGQSSTYATVAGRLKRLNQAARDLVREGRKHAHSFQQQRPHRARH